MTDTDKTASLRPYYDKYTFDPYPGYSSLAKDGTIGNSTKSVGFFQSTVNKWPSTLSGGGGVGRKPNELLIPLDTDLSGADTYALLGMSMLRKYGRLFSSQPFETGRILLQVADWPQNSSVLARDFIEDDSKVKESRRSALGHGNYDVSDEESEYFSTPNELKFGATTKDSEFNSNKTTDSDETEQGKEKAEEKDDGKVVESSAEMWGRLGFTNTLNTEHVKLFDIMFAIVDKDGLKGLWRGFHTTFVYDVAVSTLESWISGFISVIVGIPDPSFVEVLHSPYPLLSLGVATVSSVLAALLVAPIDLMRMKFLVTNFTGESRSFRKSLIKLKTFAIPSLVAIPTALHSGLPSIIRRGTPYFLYRRLGIDSKKNPSWYNLCSLSSTVLEVFVKVPLETLMRRSQLASLELSRDQLLVAPAPYDGVLASIWKVLIGQEYLESYFRGWRVSISGALGDWGLEALENGDRTRERF